jgi:hypothetical protein
MRKLIATALVLAGCISKATDIPPVSAGEGLVVKGQVLSIDPAKVPLLPECAPNQLVVKGPAGTFVCASAAANAQSLGGKAADSYALKTDTVSNAMTLGSHPASDFLSAGAQSVDSALLGGKGPSSYAAATAEVANNSALFGGKPPSGYAAATGGVANNSAMLNGLAADSYASATLGVANSAAFATNATNATNASNAKTVGGVAASQFIRNDAAGSGVGPIILTVPGTMGGTLELGTLRANSAGIYGSNSGGNLHLDSGSGKVYLNYTNGNGIELGQNARVNTAGNVTAASFNGLQVIRRDLAVACCAGTSCEDVCNSATPTGGCLSARVQIGAPFLATSCGSKFNDKNLACYCAAF